jgi:hypothetical protein
MTDKREYSPGWGDGKDAVIADDIFRVDVEYNSAHPHLPGDFISRKTDGKHVLIKWDKFDNLSEAIRWLDDYWGDCRAHHNDLDDYQIGELTRRMAALRRMVGV